MAKKCIPKKLRAVYYIALCQQTWKTKDIEALTYMAYLLGIISVSSIVPKIIGRKDDLFDAAVGELFK